MILLRQPDSPWVVIHMAHNEDRAAEIKTALEREGFLVKARPVARSVSSGDGTVEILVLSSEAQEARDVLEQMM